MRLTLSLCIILRITEWLQCAAANVRYNFVMYSVAHLYFSHFLCHKISGFRTFQVARGYCEPSDIAGYV